MIYKNDYDLETWFSLTMPGWRKKDKIKRCTLCYGQRLIETARMAKEKGFDCFTSTLLYSKYQFHEVIIEEGIKAGKKYNIEFYSPDLRKGWKEGIKISKDMNLYRQRYCGCLFSMNE